jgi:hypothetical protein
MATEQEKQIWKKLITQQSAAQASEAADLESMDETIKKAESIGRGPAGLTPPGAKAQYPYSPVELRSSVEKEPTTTYKSPEISEEGAKNVMNIVTNAPKDLDENVRASMKTLEDMRNFYEDKGRMQSAAYKKAMEKGAEDLDSETMKKMSSGEIFARILIGIAPQLVGAGIGKMAGIGYASGGVAGAQAGLSGLKRLDEAQKEIADQKQKIAEARFKAKNEAEKQKLESVLNSVEYVNKALVEIPIQQMKYKAGLAEQGVQTGLALARGMTPQFVYVQPGEERKKGEVLPPQPKGPGKEGEKGPRDLGYGMRLREDATAAMEKEARKVASKFAPVSEAFSDVVKGVEKSDLKSISKWSDAGKELSSKIAVLTSALIEYTNRGASLTANEQKLVDDFGINLEGEGSIREKMKLALTPNEVARRLRALEAATFRGAVARGTAYGVESTRPKTAEAYVKDRVQNGNLFRYDPSTGNWKFIKKVEPKKSE